MFKFWPSKNASLDNWSRDISFKVNGKVVNVKSSEVTPEVSLNTFLRTNLNLFGTKFMCLEGGCGVCVVSLKRLHPVTRVFEQFSVTSCLYPVLACDGAEVETIEFLKHPTTGYHDLQRRLAHFNGSQCGYCSPAMVMGMYNLQKQKGSMVTMQEVEKSLGGHLCRCTGYRPILDAFKSLSVDAPAKLKGYCGDIEDLPKCKTTGELCASKCAPDVVRKCFSGSEANAAEWRKAADLQDIFDILAGLRGRKYMFVGGNTAHGVYRRPADIQVFIDVNNVAQLKTLSMARSSLEVGGSVTLTDLIDILKDVAMRDQQNFAYLRELASHVELIASIAIRNVGTIAGNLMIKHQYNEFPSDLFLILETVDARLEVATGTGRNDSQTATLEEFLKINMDKRVILKLILPARNSEAFLLRTYTITPRAQNAHACINAGFLVEFAMGGRVGMVRSARVCYGGVNPRFFHASTTEKALVDRNLYENSTIQRALAALDGEVRPDWVLPDASPEFRKRLAIGLFYKFVLNTVPSSVMVDPRHRSGGALIERPISSGIQIFDTVEKNYPLTQPIIKLESLMQTSGESVYVNDIYHRPEDLWCAFVLATQINSSIVSIDPSAALALEGVFAFYSTKDIPGQNVFIGPVTIFIEENEELFVGDRVKYHGQPAGVILATSNHLALRAAGLVHITYGTPPPGSDQMQILTINDVLSSKEEREKREVVKGVMNVATSAEDSLNAVTLSGTIDMASQYHFSMETHATICELKEDGMDVLSSTQSLDAVQFGIAKVLNWQGNKTSIEVRRLGGAYGAKITRAAHIACACALACYLSKKRTRFVTSIEQTMAAVGKRNPAKGEYTVRVSPEGVIQMVQNRFISDLGCSRNENITPLFVENFPSVYRADTWRSVNSAVITDTPSNTWTRGPGSTEAIAMAENIIEHIAFVTQRDALEVRMINLDNSTKVGDMIRQLVRDAEYHRRQAEVQQFNDSNRWKKRGLAIIPISHHVLYFGLFASIVSIYHVDGTVSITHAGVEMGQGINTKVCQVAAHILGIPLSLITTKPNREFVSPNSPFTGGSNGSELVSYATLKACEELNRRLQPIRDSAPPNTTWVQLISMAYNASVELGARQYWQPFETKAYDVYGVATSEVEVDVLTGSTLVRRVDILEDTGESMSPLVDVGQVEGAFMMGLGYWLTEHLVRDPKTGELLTNRTWNYKVPGALDIPVDFRVAFLQKSPNPFGVLRSKATGEPALGMACSVMFAIRHALDSIRQDNGVPREWYNIPTPCTPEHLLLLMGNKNTDFTL